MSKIISDVLTESLLERFGIVDWGCTTDPRPVSFEHYEAWVTKGHNGILKYLEGDRKEKRECITNYFPEFESALVFQFSYANEKYELNDFYNSSESNGLKVAGYVLGFEGTDYHHVLKDRLETIGKLIQEVDPEVTFKISLDIQPVLERDLAYRAGLGFFGKNSMFINKNEGSFNLIGSLLLSKDYKIKTREVETDHCGKCTRCADACPTLAIDLNTRTIISDKCISTYTIELFKDSAEAPKGMENSNGEIFGCDICQDVCPWNKRLLRVGKITKSNKTKSSHFQLIMDYFLKRPSKEIIEELEGISNRKFQRLFFGTPLQRTGRNGLLKNLRFFSDKIKKSSL
jgi:epoxyqueuosine reductase